MKRLLILIVSNKNMFRTFNNDVLTFTLAVVYEKDVAMVTKDV